MLHLVVLSQFDDALNDDPARVGSCSARAPFYHNVLNPRGLAAQFLLCTGVYERVVVLQEPVHPGVDVATSI